MTTSTLTTSTATAFVELYFLSESFKEKDGAEACWESGQGRGARVLDKEINSRFAAAAHKVVKDFEERRENDRIFSNFWWVYSPPADFGLERAIADLAPVLVGARIEFFGFEFSQIFRSQIEALFGVNLASRSERRFWQLCPNGLPVDEEDCHRGHKCRAFLRDGAEVIPTKFIPRHLEDVLPFLEKEAELTELMPRLRKAVRGYCGTHLFAKIKKAGLEIFLDLPRKERDSWINRAA